MVTIAIPFFVMVVGAFLHLTVPRWATIGIWMFGVGLFWTLSLVAGGKLHF